MIAYRTQKYAYWFIIYNAITKDTLVIDNHSDKEIHGGWSGKGHRTSVSSPGNLTRSTVCNHCNPVLWVSLRSSDWINHCSLMIDSASTLYSQYSKGMGARSSSFITSNHILKLGTHQESPDWKKRYPCQPENFRVLRSFIFEIQGQRSNLRQKVWREGKVVHAFNHSMWKAETGWSL